jgi:hypothetical protein
VRDLPVRKNTGTYVGSVDRLNFVEGSNITLTVVRDGPDAKITIASSGAGAISVNGSSNSTGTTDFDDATPAAPAGDLNVKWQKDASSPINVSAYVDVSVLEPLLTLTNIAGTLTAAKGGTGQTSYTTGDILYASGATALSKLAAGTSGYVLTSNGAGAAPSWQAASGSSGILFAQKSADETRTNSTTVTIDADVQVSLEANTDYAFEAFLVFAAHATPDYKFGLVYPVGCTVDWNHTGDANGAAIAAETVVVNGLGAGLTTWKRHHVAGIVRNGANAGTFGIGWAQINLDAVNGTALRQGSWMRLQK